jgi:hypothetical protein
MHYQPGNSLMHLFGIQTKKDAIEEITMIHTAIHFTPVTIF